MLRTMRLRSLLLLLSVTPLLAACSDDFTNKWDVFVDSVSLYSASRPELIGRNSAYDFADGIPFPVETPGITGRWDVALTDVNGGLALLPVSSFPGLDTRAGIATIGNRTLEEVTSAPSDTSLYTRAAVTMQVGTVYVIRTRRIDCGGITGVRYGKFEPLEIDVANGILRFRSIVNPFCNNRRLIPD